MYLATILKFALPATAMITAVTVGVTYYNAAEVPPLPAIAAPAVPEMPAPVAVAPPPATVAVTVQVAPAPVPPADDRFKKSMRSTIAKLKAEGLL
jgi:hypothetical protein